MNRLPNSAFAVIDFGRTLRTCMDVTCPCGGHVHVHGRKDESSSEHIRCPWCKDVLRVGADVNLLSNEEDFDVNVGIHVYIQWKGTDVVMTAHCTCQKTFEVAKDFAYECDCPHCGAHYHCESRLSVTKLTAEEALSVASVNEPDKDLDDMNDEERAAFDVKMQTLWAEQRRNRPVHDLAGLELGHLVGPDHAFLNYSSRLDGNAQVVVMLGDVVDVFLPEPLAEPRQAEPEGSIGSAPGGRQNRHPAGRPRP